MLFINKFVTAKILSNRVNEKYESMLAVGVDEMSWDDLSDVNYGALFFIYSNDCDCAPISVISLIDFRYLTVRHVIYSSGCHPISVIFLNELSPYFLL